MDDRIELVSTGVPRSLRQLFEVAYGHVARDWRGHVISGPQFVRISETGPTVANANSARERLQWQPESKFDDMVAEMIDANVVALRDAH
jgi:GDPmannose 4,6-dehydratase